MPFYPALPYERPEVARPFTAMATGFGFANQQAQEAARTNALREVAKQPAMQRQAMEAYQQGDPSKIYTVNPDLAMKLDDNQRKVASEAGSYIMENGPYIQTPEQYKQFYSDFYRTHKGVSKAMLPSPDGVQTPEEVKSIMDTGVKHAIDIKRQIGDVEGKQKVDVATGIYKAVEKPKLELEQGYLKDRMGIDYKNHLSLQENKQNFEKLEMQKNRDLEGKIKTAATDEHRQMFFLKDLHDEMGGLDRLYQKQLEQVIEKVPPKQQAAAVEKLRYEKEYLQNEALKTRYKPLADKFNIPLPMPVRDMKAPGEEAPTGDAAKAAAILRARGVLK